MRWIGTSPIVLKTRNVEFIELGPRFRAAGQLQYKLGCGWQCAGEIDTVLTLKGNRCKFNPRRRHSTIGYMSPMEFEAKVTVA